MSVTQSDSWSGLLAGLLSDVTGISLDDDGADPGLAALPGVDPEARVAFNAIDELCLHLGTERFPWTIQVEVRAPEAIGALDERRLRHAVQVAAARHPMARARMVPARLTDRTYDWEIVPVLELDPVRVIRVADDEAMNRLRADVLSATVPLDQAPPFRLWLARRAGGDSLVLAASHVATDGVGAASLLRSILRAYAGLDDPVAPLDPVADRDLAAIAGPQSVAEHVGRLVGVATAARRATGRLSRIAVEGGDADAAGFGFHHVALPAATVAGLDPKAHTDATVNDILMAALHLAISDWNADHYAETGRVSVMMPMNLRPAERSTDGMANLVAMTAVRTGIDDREDAATLVRAVAQQTRAAKRSGSATLLIDVLDHSDLLPAVAKKAIPLLSPLAGDALIDTAVLSNLGRLAETFDFGPGADDPGPREAEPGGGRATEVWFSPPARMPLGVGVGVVTHDGDLFLTFRYCAAQFDAAAAEAFAGYMLSALEYVG